jgi:hypothetical protein
MKIKIRIAQPISYKEVMVGVDCCETKIPSWIGRNCQCDKCGFEIEREFATVVKLDNPSGEILWLHNRCFEEIKQ